jgi:hypothetical protein
VLISSRVPGQSRNRRAFSETPAAAQSAGYEASLLHKFLPLFPRRNNCAFLIEHSCMPHCIEAPFKREVGPGPWSLLRRNRALVTRTFEKEQK